MDEEEGRAEKEQDGVQKEPPRPSRNKEGLHWELITRWLAGKVEWSRHIWGENQCPGRQSQGTDPKHNPRIKYTKDNLEEMRNRMRTAKSFGDKFQKGTDGGSQESMK